MVMYYPVILAGGVGSRLWPQSRPHCPKPLLSFLHSDTLLQNTLARLHTAPQAPIILANQSYALSMLQQCKAMHITPQQILAEPMPRGTAAAMVLAAVAVAQHNPQGIILLLPADHRVENIEAWQNAVQQAIVLAQQQKFVVFGVQPTTPETGYGYIMPTPNHEIDYFIEKPSAHKAQQLIDQGALWNAGMFAVRVDVCKMLIERAHPTMWQTVAQAYAQAQQGEENICLVHESFANVPNDTIDYAIAERLAPHEGAVVPLPPCGWSDIGNWQSMYNAMPHDADGNAIMGAPVAHDCKNSLIRSDGRPVIALGLENTAVIVDRDAILVAPMHKLDQLRQAVTLLPQISPPTPKDLINYRQWGHYYALLETPNYCAKVLYVAPQKMLSLQHHNYREEFWTVVEGSGFALVGDVTHTLTVGSSVHIATGAVHRLMNPHNHTLVVIEVQLGNCISEFDIVRYNEPLEPVITSK